MKSPNINLILGSGSPRRKELLAEMGYEFRVQSLKTDESFPAKLHPAKVAEFVANKKSLNFQFQSSSELLITADTTVIVGDTILTKPQNKEEATYMLESLSNQTHEVITGVCLRNATTSMSFSTATSVSFLLLSSQQIAHYITNFKPFDKAGAYGIQEWIGMIGVSEIKGSYTNVVGLPTAQTHEAIQQFISSSF